MAGMREIARRFASDRSGATTIEYALICGLIFSVVVGGVVAVSGGMEQSFNNTSEELGVMGGGGGDGGGDGGDGGDGGG